LKRIYFLSVIFLVFARSPAGYSQVAEDTLFTTIKIKKGDTLWKLFGKNWKFVSRLNRIGPKALRKGTVLNVPRDWKIAEKYTPAPDSLKETAIFEQFILVDLKEQYVAGYEKGAQKFWYPISSGWDTTRTPNWYIRYKVKHDSIYSGRIYKTPLPDMSTPAGFFKIRAKDSTHVSSAFMTEDSVGSPMPWALMFAAGYWFHGTGNEPEALPGFPASHGCVRLFDDDAFKLYRWAKHGTPVLIVKGREEIVECLKVIPKSLLPKKSKKKSSRK
jgi:lipoprotein-anchoring transpeptidase ErfK/SrfK